MIDPLKDALVPSPAVIEGCTESVSYEFGGRGGVITYNYPRDKQPDTKADSLSLAFITGSGDAVLFRVDSAQSEDYLMLALIKGILTVSYNLGTEDIVVTDRKRRLNDGLHHVVRFERVGPNSTLQVDDNKKISSTPDGRHLTVFNSQSLLQVGGRWNEISQALEHPFTGVLSGISYNGLRPLDMAHDKRDRTRLRGGIKSLKSIPFNYKDLNPDLFLESESVIQSTELYIHDGSGEGSKQDSTSHLIGVRFPEGGFMPCEDDEDLCDPGSGSGPGGHGVFPESDSLDMSQSVSGGSGGGDDWKIVNLTLLGLVSALLN